HRELHRIACSCHGIARAGRCISRILSPRGGRTPELRNSVIREFRCAPPELLRVRAHVAGNGTLLRCSIGARTMSGPLSKTPIWNPTTVPLHPIDKTRDKRRGGA